MINAIADETAMMADIGVADRLLKTLTQADAAAPSPNCMVPNSAEATPAFLENGAMDKADVFG